MQKKSDRPPSTGAARLPSLFSSPTLTSTSACRPKCEPIKESNADRQDAWVTNSVVVKAKKDRPASRGLKEDDVHEPLSFVAPNQEPSWMRDDPGPSGSWWKSGPLLGAGSYGNVYKAMNTETGEVFAVKHAAVDRNSDEGRDVCLLKEMKVLQGLRHPHIVSYLGHEYVNDCLCICLEYMAGGSLRDLVNEFGALDHQLLQRATRGVLEGLNYLHTRKPLVVHRDLKGANVLVDQEFWPKLVDFGCSTYSSLGSQTFFTAGSLPWMAPEVITAEQSNKRGSGRRSDVWSLGCLILELATAANPWGKNRFSNPLQAYSVIGRSEKTPPVPDSLSGDSRDFVSLCLNRDPSQRPWCSELIAHPFVDVGEREVAPAEYAAP